MRSLVVLAEENSAVPLRIPAIAHVRALIRVPHDGPWEEMPKSSRYSRAGSACFPYFTNETNRATPPPRAAPISEKESSARERGPTRSECRRINYVDRSEPVIN